MIFLKKQVSKAHQIIENGQNLVSNLIVILEFPLDQRKKIVDMLNNKLIHIKFHITNLKNLSTASANNRLSDKETLFILSQVDIIINKSGNVAFGSFEKIYDKLNESTGAHSWKNFDSQSLIGARKDKSVFASVIDKSYVIIGFVCHSRVDLLKPKNLGRRFV